MAIAKEDGKFLWPPIVRSESKPILSDPFIVQGKIIILTGVCDSQECRISWSVVDPDTGDIDPRKEMLRLRLSWLTRASAEVQPLADGAIVQLGGCILSCDATGEVRWLRHEVYTPDEEDKQWVLQHYRRPLVDEEHVFSSQPGVRSIQCLDRATGKSIWCRVLATATGILAHEDGRLILAMEDGLAALDAATGEVLWHEKIEESHPAWLISGGKILSLERQRIEPGKDPRRNILVWREAATGETIATAQLDGLDRNDPRLGLLVPHKDRLWTFFGENQQDANRRLIELVPNQEAKLIRP
jgi:outer membrane protein assembly factor BamB